MINKTPYGNALEPAECAQDKPETPIEESLRRVDFAIESLEADLVSLNMAIQPAMRPDGNSKADPVLVLAGASPVASRLHNLFHRVDKMRAVVRNLTDRVEL